jgi:hypothetical protein
MECAYYEKFEILLYEVNIGGFLANSLVLGSQPQFSLSLRWVVELLENTRNASSAKAHCRPTRAKGGNEWQNLSETVDRSRD